MCIKTTISSTYIQLQRCTQVSYVPLISRCPQTQCTSGRMLGNQSSMGITETCLLRSNHICDLGLFSNQLRSIYEAKRIVCKRSVILDIVVRILDQRRSQLSPGFDSRAGIHATNLPHPKEMATSAKQRPLVESKM